MLRIDLGTLREPQRIVEAVYAGLEQELRNEDLLAYLGDDLRNHFSDYYQSHTRLVGWPHYFRYLHARKLETLVGEIQKRSTSVNTVRVLDVGCGTGTQSIVAGLLGAEVHGIDLNARSVNVARRRCEWYQDRLDRPLKVTFDCEDAGRIDSLNLPQHDIVFSQGAVMFFHPIDGFLNGATKSLRARGALIITCANGIHPINLVLFFRRFGGFGFCFETHRPLTPREMRRRLESKGFEVKVARGYGFAPPVLVERSRKLRHWISLLEQLIPAKLSYMTGLTYLIVGEKMMSERVVVAGPAESVTRAG